MYQCVSSISDADMQVVTPMETIPEGVAINMHQISTNNQGGNGPVVGSPQSSPLKSRRIHNMILNGLKSSFGNSKLSLEGVKVGSAERDSRLTQPLNGVGLCSRQSYLEDWLSEHESTTGGYGSTNLSKSPTIADSLPQTPNTEGVFPMELEEDIMNPTQKTANHDLKLHLLGLGFHNRDVERVRQNHVTASVAGSTDNCSSNGNVSGAGASSTGTSRKAQQSVLASAPEVFKGLEQREKTAVVRHHSLSSSTDKSKKKQVKDYMLYILFCVVYVRGLNCRSSSIFHR